MDRTAAEDQRFEWATDLKPGMHVLLASGQEVPVLALSRHDEKTTVRRSGSSRPGRGSPFRVCGFLHGRTLLE